MQSTDSQVSEDSEFDLLWHLRLMHTADPRRVAELVLYFISLGLLWTTQDEWVVQPFNHKLAKWAGGVIICRKSTCAHEGCVARKQIKVAARTRQMAMA